jgi:hypothetical protein
MRARFESGNSAFSQSQNGHGLLPCHATLKDRKMLDKVLFAAIGFVFCGGAVAAGSLENPQPNSIESGIGVVSGWNCQATTITIQVDDAPPVLAPYGSLRADTSAICGGNITTGFSYLINYNTLTTGAHTIKAFADGVMFGTATFNTVNLGSEFLSGKAGEYFLQNFPAYGTRTRVTWQESKQNFIITGSDAQVAPIDGTYFGTITATNSGCTVAANNGSGHDFYTFTVTFGAQGVLSLVAANTASSCTFAGIAFYTNSGGYIVVPSGDFSCTNGLHGNWAADRMVFDAVGLLANLTTKYTVGETCSTVTHIGGAR